MEFRIFSIGDHAREGEAIHARPAGEQLSPEQIRLLHAEQDVIDGMEVYGKTEIADRLISVIDDVAPELLDEFLEILGLPYDFPLNKLSDVLAEQLEPGENEKARSFLENHIGSLIDSSTEQGDMVSANALMDILKEYDIEFSDEANLKLDDYIGSRARNTLENQRREAA